MCAGQVSALVGRAGGVEYSTGVYFPILVIFPMNILAILLLLIGYAARATCSSISSLKYGDSYGELERVLSAVTTWNVLPQETNVKFTYTGTLHADRPLSKL